MTAYDEAYSEYLKDKEPVVVDGVYFYKVIYKERLSFEIRGCRCISVMLPAEMFRVQWSQIVEDENGRQFELVGPVYHGSDKDAEFLAKCYENSLELAKSNRLKSIAFCAISTGVYGYPIKEATQIALTTVNNWLKQNKDYVLKVVFCCYSKHDTDIYINTALALKIASREENIWVPRIVFSHKNKRISHCLPMSSYCVEQRVDLQLDERMVRNMLDSHISCDMGDHWDLLYEDGKIYCYRSWTGYCIYVADVSPSGHIGRVLICQDENQYSASVEDALATCLKIIPGYFKHDQDYYDD